MSSVRTKRRWGWVPGARALDARLGTLGYLPWEARHKIYRYVLDEYIDEAITYRMAKFPIFQPTFDPSAAPWLAMKQRFEDEFEVETTGFHDTKDAKPYEIFSLRARTKGLADPRLKKPVNQEPDFAMPLRLASPHIGFEFDRVFLSAMFFEFSCHNALHHFLNELAVTSKLPHLRNIIIRIHGCKKCSRDDTDAVYNDWSIVLADLPRTLEVIYFDLSDSNGGFRAFQSGLGPWDLTRVKEALDFFRTMISSLAGELRLVETPDPHFSMPYAWQSTRSKTVLNLVDAMIRETDYSIDEAEETRKWLAAQTPVSGQPFTQEGI